MGIGNNIKQHRLKNNLTQKELAEKLHISFQAVSKWEKDETEPSFDTLKDMSQIFNCSIDELFGIEKNEVKQDEKEEIQKEPENAEAVEKREIERVELNIKNPYKNIVEDIYKGFNWKVMSKVSVISSESTKFVFEREKNLENDHLDYKAYLAKRYMDSEIKIVPRTIIYGIVGTLIMFSIMLILMLSSRSVEPYVYVLIFSIISVPFYIMILIGIRMLIRNIRLKKKLLARFEILLRDYAVHNDLGLVGFDYLVAELSKHNIPVHLLYFYEYIK